MWNLGWNQTVGYLLCNMSGCYVFDRLNTGGLVLCLVFFYKNDWNWNDINHSSCIKCFFFDDNDNFVIKLISLSFPDSDREN